MKAYSKLVLLCSLLIAMPVSAETPAEKFEREMKHSREIISNQRFDLVKQYMGLTAFEEKQFLGVYNRYRDAMKPISDAQTKLVTDYVTAYTNNKLTDKLADHFTRSMFDLAGKKLTVRKKFVSEFQVFLKPRPVARFMQLENKLDAIMSYDLARKIPLVPTDNAKAPAHLKID